MADIYIGALLSFLGGFHQGIFHQDSHANPDLPGICTALSLHLCCDEEDNGATEAPFYSSAFPI